MPALTSSIGVTTPPAGLGGNLVLGIVVSGPDLSNGAHAAVYSGVALVATDARLSASGAHGAARAGVGSVQVGSSVTVNAAGIQAAARAGVGSVQIGGSATVNTVGIHVSVRAGVAQTRSSATVSVAGLHAAARAGTGAAQVGGSITVSAVGARPAARVGVPVVLVPAPFVFTGELDAFAADPGLDAGGIVPVGIVPNDGAFVFCLGHDAPGFFALLRGGDYVEVSQTDTLPTGNVATFQARTRAPAATLPAGYAWVVSALVDGGEVGRRTLGRAPVIDWEWYVDVARLTGVHTLAFRLTLTGPTDLVELEVPAFYLDAIVFETVTNVLGQTGAGPPIITNEEPVDGGVIGTTFDCDILGLGTDVDPASVIVSQSDTHGTLTPLAATIGARGEIVHVHLTAPTVPPEGLTILVRAQLVGSMAQVSRSFFFQEARSRPETIASIVALELERLRVTWTGTVQMDNPAAPHDSLNPALYTLQAVQPDPETPCLRGSLDPGLLPRVVRVEPVQRGNFTNIHSFYFIQLSIVDLILDVEITPGISYVVTEAGVATPIGTFSGPTGMVTSLGDFTTSSATAAPFVLPWPTERVFDLWRLLPRMNRVEDVTHDLARFVRCLQEPANLLLTDVDNWTDILSLDTAPEPMLDAMLADLGNPFPFVLTVEKKRALIPLLKTIYSLQGLGCGMLATVHFFLYGFFDSNGSFQIRSYVTDTMKLGISQLGGTAGVGSWILGPGTSWPLYAFDLVALSTFLTADQMGQVVFIANYMKPAHTHLVSISSNGPTYYTRDHP